jgi:hypothetical protein
MQMWTRIGGHHLSGLLRNRRYPRRPDMTINLPALKTPVNMDNNYGLRLTAYYRVSVKSETVLQYTTVILCNHMCCTLIGA